MSELINTRVLLKKRPVGEPREDDFDIQEVVLREPGDNELLVKTRGCPWTRI